MDASSPQLIALQDQIKVLSDLQSRLSAIRQVPASLLRQPIGNNDPFNTVRTQGAKEDFQKLKELGDEIRSDSVQKALHGARERMEADGSHLDANYRRDSRKGRRAPSPESPKPYVPADRARTSFFRLPDSDPAPPLYAEDLVRYAREFNKTQQSCRLHIWEKTRGRREDASRILRFTIPDVLIAYLTLGYSSADKTAIVQMLSAFGPRERKAPHSQSAYGVYQALSQEIAKMMEAEERVSVGDVVQLLCRYEDLFIEPCLSCGRVMSAEGYAPPIVRVWRDGVLEKRHVTCMAE
ncbi:hypothetical protein EST38_g13462 [Candolleomyces aberdarensis]|uniref:Uncharacterized protein n=1 Tax=Candolleomyces aberdarensis TaxID=2316362 RepID=A0A4Q2D252_9AGAR|nr:hypothetical protein EST38_g13462 [Candolleomyces aberdarensis]